jgi:hypothetical protein
MTMFSSCPGNMWSARSSAPVHQIHNQPAQSAAAHVSRVHRRPAARAVARSGCTHPTRGVITSSSTPIDSRV